MIDLRRVILIAAAMMSVFVSAYILTTEHYYLAMAPAFIIPAAIFLVRVPAAAVLALFFLEPFSAFTKLSQGYDFLTVPKFLGMFIVGLMGLTLLLDPTRWRDLRSKLWPWLFMFLFMCILAALLTPYTGMAVNYTRRLITGYLIVMMALVFIKPDIFKTGLLHTLVASIAISAGLSVFGYLFQLPMFVMNADDQGSLARAVGAATDPNFFASMVMFGLPLTVHQAIFASSFRSRLFFSALAGICCLAVMLTYSRSGTVVLVITLAALLIGNIRRITFRQAVFGSICGLGFLTFTLATIPDHYWERQASLVQAATDGTTDRSLSRRMSYLGVGISGFMENPIIGSGLGAFREFYGASDVALNFQRDGLTNKRAAHNLYIEVAVGTGILGSIAFAGLLMTAFWNFHRAHGFLKDLGDEQGAHLIASYRLGLISFLIFSMFLSALYHKYLWIGIAVSQLALNYALAKRKEMLITSANSQVAETQKAG